MAPRATWKGHVKLSLVSFGVRLYNATTTMNRISLNQLHRTSHQRLKQQMICPVEGPTDRADIVKGYEYEKGRYVIIEPDDLEKIQIETTKVIEISQFVDRDEVRPVFLNGHYYVAPDGPVAVEAFAVVREALRRSNKVGIGRFTVAGREHVVTIEPEEKGLHMTTMRSEKEVRAPGAYFDDIEDVQLDDDQLALAEQLIQSKTKALDTSIFRDRYQDALLELIKAKVEGKEPEIIEVDEAPSTLSFMEALEASLAESGLDAPATKTTKKPPARRVEKKTTRKKKQA